MQLARNELISNSCHRHDFPVKDENSLIERLLVGAQRLHHPIEGF